ncbi:hypothetical protein BKA65DRAFT_273579 [Rhexocercosporidium sp. MPI-PUGE-AT-0058]|nr:hypothetical protein BKA65DRAFT_273579 [Rhexocercosporidium sp. MPI-PUGE-AT-0058]
MKAISPASLLVLAFLPFCYPSVKFDLSSGFFTCSLRVLFEEARFSDFSSKSWDLSEHGLEITIFDVSGRLRLKVLSPCSSDFVYSSVS